MSKVFYVPGARSALDGAVLVDGVYRGLYGGKTLEDYPGAAVIDSGDARQQIEKLCITDPVEIDADRFQYMLEVLPPMAWTGCDGSAESFKMCEFTNGRVTCTAVRLGDRYFSFEDVANLPHAACIEKVRDWLARS